MLEPKTISVGEHTYLLGRLDMFKALEVSRLAAPLLPVLFHEVLSRLALEALRGKESTTPDERIEEVGRLIQISEPILKAVAALPEKDFTKIVRTCLSCAERKLDSDRGWARVINADGVLMYADMSQHDIWSIVLHVMARELRPTIAALGLFAGAAAQAKAGSLSENSPADSTTS